MSLRALRVGGSAHSLARAKAFEALLAVPLCTLARPGALLSLMRERVTCPTVNARNRTRAPFAVSVDQRVERRSERCRCAGSVACAQPAQSQWYQSHTQK